MPFVIDDIIFAAAAIAGIGASVASVSAGNKAAKNQRRAQKIQRDADNLRAVQERRRTIREGRLREAAAQQNAWNQGVGTSSGAYGGQGSITTQMNSGISFIDDQQQAATISGSFMDKASKQESLSNMWGSVANLAFTGAQMSGGSVDSLFGMKPAQTIATPPVPSWQGRINSVRQYPRKGPY